MKLYRLPDFPVELAIPLDHLMHAKASTEQDVVAFVGNPDNYRLGLGKRTSPDTFDLAALKADGVYVEKRPYAGSGFFCGPEDVYFSLQVNRLSLDDPDESANEVFARWVETLLGVVRQLGVDAHIQYPDARTRNVNDVVCMNLTGRNEIVDADGHKLVAGIFKDDGLVISMSGVMLISRAWLRIYEYLNAPAHYGGGTCIKDLVGKEGLTDEVIDILCRTFDNVESQTLTDSEYEILRKLVARFKVQ